MVGKFFCEDIHWLPNCVVVNYRKLYDTLNRNILQALTYTQTKMIRVCFIEKSSFTKV